MKLCAVAVLCSAFLCYGASAQDNSSWKYPEPITYDSLRAWHKAGGLQSYYWPKEHQADLNGDGSNEVFLGVAGYGRGMVYALFTRRGHGWVLLSDSIDGSHHDFEVLPSKHGSWHDFQALLPSGRGGLFKIVYTWNGKEYVRKSEREITAAELHSKP